MKQIVYVNYSPGNIAVMDGTDLTLTQVKSQPVVHWPVDSNAYYTLAMIDPDAPCRAFPIISQIKHWLVINIPGADVANGRTLAEYYTPAPPPGSGYHRYVFLVYKQPALINTTEPTVTSSSITGRLFFKIRDFARAHNLGEPVAVNYFKAKFEN
ncbi:unnamed protein product [Oppiella nova]|uniref:Phosphatidylethanolamine-binding protein n=1 Tax=Oppiella nova TaxID=334625 RepID=A0A7R9LP28_9ACAR|nr:unnamed protein product [Oppiella nova]CAG2165569.1 unnamed protein product [Oppiella nova]